MTVSNNNLDVLPKGGRLVLGNWKMHGSILENRELVRRLLEGSEELPAGVLAGVCVPFPYLAQARELLHASDISWGAQDVSCHPQGAYTGEVSAQMLSDFGCTWVLVGHSERRSMHGENSAQVAEKAQKAIKRGITPVVCVGESFKEHEDGAALDVIRQQLKPILALGAEQVSKMVIAYEPIWAIGTGLTATPEQAQTVHAYIRSLAEEIGVNSLYILYGGSVKADNAASLFAMPDINGALVGGASLDANDFLAIAAVEV
ncbi:MAG: triose-phosphate isomerase [Alcaligenaceae bacterium]|nr:triose-phosphate isomerase [Alcaligenaceae bacterium]